MKYVPYCPPLPIIRALKPTRSEIQSAFNETLEHAIIYTTDMDPAPRSHEVAILCHFFMALPALQSTLDSALKPFGLRVQVKGVFGHHSQPFGPVVDLGKTGGRPGCELCDIMFIVTYGVPNPGGPFANATFFQAKLQRSKIVVGRSSQRQCLLYQRTKSFRFRSPDLYTSGLPDRTPAGWRDMPGPETSGFCFWSFEARRPEGNAWGWPWHASAVAVPALLADQAADRTFGEALYQLMAGQFGLAVERPLPDDFAWSRIVHDFILRAAKEPLGYTYGAATLPDLQRVAPQPVQLERLLKLGLPVVANPFKDFFSYFGSDDLNRLAEAYARAHNRIPAPKLQQLLNTPLHSQPEIPEPPRWEPPPGPEDTGGGGSFVHIDISSATA